ncbi:MAG: acylphosphatase [Candidatus Pacearchaeota archaeon]
MKKAIKVIVNGSVQGVFFRQFVKDTADKLNIRGFVRNLENGDVEIFAEGDNDNISFFLDKVKEGPKHAIIKNLTIEEKKWSGEFKDFKILHF